MQFEWADGWLLMSVLGGGPDGADLSMVIGAGDMLNHAIFNLEELQDGFARLLAAGLVVNDNGRFKATESAWELYRKIEGRRLGMFTQLDAFARMLQSMPFVSQADEQEWALSSAEFEQAVEANQEIWHQYRRRLEKRLPKMVERHRRRADAPPPK